ncbi:MAG: hypothetical protein BGO36_00180 [Burkholderiales bacterium 68-10]|nr:MAG: hypothetical protein BGO36_00180 [Burkholderiales bacterium 68-10]
MRQRLVGARRLTEFARQLLVDVAQAGRRAHTRGDGKGQSAGLARAVVGVLPEDDHAHRLGRRQLQRAQRLGRIDGGPGGQAGLQKIAQPPPLGAAQKAPHQRLPAGGQRIQPGGPGGKGGSRFACSRHQIDLQRLSIARQQLLFS